MRIVKIAATSSGGHDNQTSEKAIVLPEGWAVIPNDMKTENFPFGEVEAKKVKGVMTVTKWTPGVLPEIKEEEPPVTAFQQLRADVDFIAVMTGVSL